MDFNSAISLIAAALSTTGTKIDINQYDGAIVKKLEASNTLDDGRTTNQTHIAITGVQMDIFPYLRADGYFNDSNSDADLKKYFIPQIPVCIYETNYSYLGGDSTEDGIVFKNGIIEGKTSVVRSKRKNQADQIQVSLINFDTPDFVAFRRLLHAGSYLILLKRLKQFKYDVFGLIPGRGVEADGNLQMLNNQFFKLSTNTVLDATLATNKKIINEAERLDGGANIILYGVPGSGKSWTIEHEYCHENSIVERLVFHPDYTNADFIGQILPVVDAEKQVTYEFTAGPFTTILRDAYRNPKQEYILIIEEVNRGNAPAIFGEVFQLLDRTVESKMIEGITYPIGTSEYGITHKYMSEIIYGEPTHKVRIPSNLSIVSTMNTSDQNVYTLDTAFQRRWNMRLIENTFENVRPSLANAKILDTEVTWETFCTTINKLVVGNKAKMASAEDKRLGVYFIHESDIKFDDKATSPNNDLRGEYNVLLKAERDGNMTLEQKERLYDIRKALKKIRKFPEKVIKYLWDDAFKFNPEALFDTDNMESLEQVIRTFVYSTGRDRFKIFKPTVRSTFYPDSQS